MVANKQYCEIKFCCLCSFPACTQATPLNVELSLRLLTFVEISSVQISLVNRVNRLYITRLSFLFTVNTVPVPASHSGETAKRRMSNKGKIQTKYDKEEKEKGKLKLKLYNNTNGRKIAAKCWIRINYQCTIVLWKGKNLHFGKEGENLL